MGVTTAQSRAEVWATRFDHCLTRLRALARTNPEVRDVLDELVRLRRDMAGLTEELPPPAEAPARAAPGSLRALRTSNAERHSMKERDGLRHCPKHNDGEGAWVPVADFDVKNRTTGALRSWCLRAPVPARPLRPGRPEGRHRRAAC